MLAGALCGVLFSLTLKEVPEICAFAGGYMHAFPAKFSGKALFEALLFQVFPTVLLYLGAFGVLAAPMGTAVLFARAFIGSAGCAFIYKSCMSSNGHISGFLFFLLCAAEMLTMTFYHSSAVLAVAYSKKMGDGGKGERLFAYTMDALFFLGLIFIFYLLRGCVVLLLSR